MSAAASVTVTSVTDGAGEENRWEEHSGGLPSELGLGLEAHSAPAQSQHPCRRLRIGGCNSELQVWPPRSSTIWALAQ